MRRLLLVVLAGVVFSLTACAVGQLEAAMQGTWVWQRGEESLEWNFNNGYFTRRQAVDARTTLISEGLYRVLESGENLLVLELFDIRGDRFTYSNADVQVRVEVVEGGEAILVDGVEFGRGGP